MTAEKVLLWKLLELAEEVTQYTWEEDDADPDVIAAIDNLREFMDSTRELLEKN